MDRRSLAGAAGAPAHDADREPSLSPSVSLRLRCEHAARTRTGSGRSENEDAFIADPAAGLFGVADGIGGRPAGGLASALVLATVREAIARADRVARVPADLVLRAAVEEANHRLLATAEQDPATSGMGTTFTGALVRGGSAVIAHVGDSRAYVLHGRHFNRLTEDHVLQNDAVWGALDLTQRAKLKHARRGLVRSVGTTERVEVSVGILVPQHGDVLLLCTDGLTAVLAEKEIAGILIEHGDPVEAAERLLARADDHGAVDDMTAVVVRWVAPGGCRGRA
jgi:protein phosphatase